MARLRAAILKTLLLLVIPAAAFWACVTIGSSVMLAIAALTAWFAVLVCLPSLRLQNVSLVLLAIAAGYGGLELLLRTNVMASVMLGRDIVGIPQIEVAEPPLKTQDETLGLRLLPNRRSHAVMTKDGRTVYDAIYTTDANGYRALPPGPRGETSVLMLGDSFNFGVGINDDQTLAFYLRDLSDGRLQPVNLAMPTLGVHQVLRQLEIGEPAKSGHRKFSWALLTIVDDHVLRASGRASWLRDTPRYEVEAGDRLVLRGTYRDSSKFMENLMAGSRLFALTRNALFANPATDRDRFVRILREIKSRLSSEYGAKLMVLYYSGQTWRGDLTGARDEMTSLFCQAGVDYIDVNALLRITPEVAGRFYLPDDGHPTPQLNRLLAPAVIARMADTSRSAACPR